MMTFWFKFSMLWVVMAGMVVVSSIVILSQDSSSTVGFALLICGIVAFLLFLGVGIIVCREHSPPKKRVSTPTITVDQRLEINTQAFILTMPEVIEQ
jgi:hypothetical protein